MSVTFYDVKLGDRVFFPGNGMWGKVKHIDEFRKNRKGVTVILESGNEILYLPGQWYALDTDKGVPSVSVAWFADQEKQLKKQPKEPVQIMGLSTPKVITKQPKSLPEVKLPKNVVKSKRSFVKKGVICEDLVEDTRPVPDIPGPPVAKPLHGVWDELGIACLRNI